MTPEEYASHDALGLKELLDRGEVSAAELHDIAQQGIEALDPILNFMVARSSEEAQRALNEMNPNAPFAGIPMLVKGGVGMTGQPVAPACRLGEGLMCHEDSEFVSRLKQAGFVILGSTNIPEACNSLTTESLHAGAARNP